jgi:hypothetical protein
MRAILPTQKSNRTILIQRIEVRYDTFMKLVLMIAATMCYSSSANAQQLEPESDTCTLSNYQSGHQVVLDGTVTSGGSATLLHVAGCKYPVVIQYPSNLRENEKEDVPSLRQDDKLNKLNSELKDHPTRPVGASLFGRLDVAKPIPRGQR